MVINRDHDHDYEDHDDSSKDYNGQQKRTEPGNDYGEYNDDDGCGGDYDDGQHSGQEECAEPDNDDDEYNNNDDGGVMIMMIVGSIVGSRGTLSLLLKFQASRLRLPAFQLLAFRLTRQQDYL